MLGEAIRARLTNSLYKLIANNCRFIEGMNFDNDAKLSFNTIRHTFYDVVDLFMYLDEESKNTPTESRARIISIFEDIKKEYERPHPTWEFGAPLICVKCGFKGEFFKEREFKNDK